MTEVHNLISFLKDGQQSEKFSMGFKIKKMKDGLNKLFFVNHIDEFDDLDMLHDDDIGFLLKHENALIARMREIAVSSDTCLEEINSIALMCNGNVQKIDQIGTTGQSKLWGELKINHACFFEKNLKFISSEN